MEFVGRSVRKKFPGFGVFSGVVVSYDPSVGYFKVVYDDGDSEELDYGEIASMLMEASEEAAPPRVEVKRKRGRPPKKRMRNELDLAGGEDADLGSGRVVATGLVRDDGRLMEPNGVLEVNTGSFSTSDCNGRVFDGVSMENGSALRVSGEHHGNDRCSEEEIASNRFSGEFAGTSPTMNLDGLHDLENGLRFGRLLEHAVEDAYGKSSERKRTRTEKLESENSNLDGTYTTNVGRDHSYSVKNNEDVANKRQKLNGKIYPQQDMPLRRSARRASAATLLPSDYFDRHMSELPPPSCMLDEQDYNLVPEDCKPKLPPSSFDLDLHGLPILNFFSVYTFLRSFSRELFLSPFSLEMFLASLRCNYANSLIDHIHFSILQTLKQHLEFLSEEGSQPAANCLRALNWDLLDLVTWPVYLAGYLLIHGSIMKSLFKPTYADVMNKEYYEHPASVKLEILRCLSDDVMEVEHMRSEINVRVNECEVSIDGYNNDYRNKNGSKISGFVEGSLVQDMAEDNDDRNSDDCCLCRMDGSLICCDGCPAAFHSRCVGVAKDLLPEGDWYCPECLIEKNDGLAKLSKSSRGAEVLGIDPHGRTYFSSCGYLLVSDSYDEITSSHFYNKDDLNVVIRVLKSSHASYAAIVREISAYWGISFDCCNSISHLHSKIYIRNDAFDAQLDPKVLSSSFQNVANDDTVKKNTKDDCPVQDSGPSGARASYSNQLNLLTSHHASVSHPSASLELGEHADHAVIKSQLSQQTIASCFADTNNTVNEIISLKPDDSSNDRNKCYAIVDQDNKPCITEQREVGTSQLQSDPGGYINYYFFGRVASSVAEDLIQKSSESNTKEPKRSDEDVMMAQMKAASKRYLNFFSSSFLKMSLGTQKEKCGWCLSCKTSSSSDCIFVVNDKHLEVFIDHAIGIGTEKKKKSHIASALHDILLLEGRLNGLLSGPWENPQYSSLWRKAVMKASTVTSLKHMLVILESNLRRVAISSDWLKPVDSVHTVGSACHVFPGSVDVLPYFDGGRKQGKKVTSASELHISQSAAPSFIYWWRGGRLSRQVFHWKMLPQSSTSKGGRQAGCKKIPNVFYPEGSEFARRSKFFAWRAAVEMSKTVAQLTFLIKEFNSNIRWLELLNFPIPQLTKDSKSLKRMFKKVIIRRKCIEGTSVKYLLDFGKRENIPPTVSRNGVIHVDSSSERKKFWLSENHVPVYLIKNFEQKKIVRSMKKMGSKLLSVKTGDFCSENPERSRGLSYLISKAEKLETKHCGYCNKNMHIRDAVNCQLCDGFFHKKHFRVPKASIDVDYICHKCKDKTSTKVKTQMHKVVSKVKKKSARKKSKILPKKRNSVLVKSKKKLKMKKKHKEIGNRTFQSRKVESGGCHKRKRTTMSYSFWLNGLRWTRKADDERVKHFRKKQVILPSQRLIRSSKKPVCCLCLEEYNSEVIYVCCEYCKDWFHGDIYNIALEAINNLIGFKCHKCRERSIPLCPFSSLAVNEVPLSKEFNILEQGTEKKLHGGSCESSLPAYTKDCLDQQKDSSTCPRDESTFTSKTECLRLCIPDCTFSYLAVNGGQLTNVTMAETSGTVREDNEEKLPCGTLESSPVVQVEDCLNEQDNSSCVRDEAIFTLKTGSSLAVNEVDLSSIFTITEAIHNVGQDAEEKKSNSTCTRDESTFTSETECLGLRIPDCSFSYIEANGGQLSNEFTMAKTFGAVGEDIEEKLSTGTLESSPVDQGEDCLNEQKDISSCVRDEAIFAIKTGSSVVVSEVELSRIMGITEATHNVGQDAEEKTDDSTCLRDESTFTSKTECLGLSISDCSFSYLSAIGGQLSNEFTKTESFGTVGEDIEETLPCGTLESSPVVQVEDCLNEHKDNSSCIRDDAIFTIKTGSSLAVNEVELSRPSRLMVITKAFHNVEQDAEQKKDSSTCARDESTLTSKAECVGLSIPDCAFSSLQAEGQLSNEFIMAEICGTVGEDIEEKLPSKTLESSPVVQVADCLNKQKDNSSRVRDEATFTTKTASSLAVNEVELPGVFTITEATHNVGQDAEEKKDSSACARDESTITSKTECLGLSIQDCSFSHLEDNGVQLLDECTMAEACDTVEENFEEKHPCGTLESSPVVPVDDYLNKQKDDSSCVRYEVIFTTKTGKSLAVNEVELSRVSAIAEAIHNAGQDAKEKIQTATFDGSLAVVHGDGYLDQKKDDSSLVVHTEDCLDEEKDHSSCVIDEAIITFNTESSLAINEIDLSRVLTVTETVNNFRQGVEDKLHIATSDISMAVFHHDDYLDQQKDDSLGPVDEATCTFETESANDSYCVSSFHQVDENVTSCKLDNDFHIVATSQELEEFK